MYKGGPPQATFARLKESLLQLEGLFHIMSPAIEREDSKILIAIQDTLAARENEDAFLRECTDASVFMKGGSRRRRGRGGRGPAGG